MLVAVEVSLVTVCVVAGFASGRGSTYWSRVFVRCLSVPALVLFAVLVAPEQVAVPLGWVTLITAMLVVPALSCRNVDRPPGPPDENGGGGPGPDPPSGSPEPPRGGVPLPDADPSRVRVRDHSSAKIRYLKRWRERQLERDPVPRPPSR